MIVPIGTSRYLRDFLVGKILHIKKGQGLAVDFIDLIQGFDGKVAVEPALHLRLYRAPGDFQHLGLIVIHPAVFLPAAEKLPVKGREQPRFDLRFVAQAISFFCVDKKGLLGQVARLVLVLG
jgi:hypothetical protein